jgi:hypothetical protein
LGVLKGIPPFLLPIVTGKHVLEATERTPPLDGLPEAILQTLILDGEDEAFHIPVGFKGISLRHEDLGLSPEAKQRLLDLLPAR